MSTQALSQPSLVCLARNRRRVLMQNWSTASALTHATEFREGMHEISVPDPDQALLKDQFLALPQAVATLECLSGSLWLTREGDIGDYFLGAGERVEIRPSAHTVVQALRPSQVRWLAI